MTVSEGLNIRRLSLKELRTNMILAKDVVSSWGSVLLPQNTALDFLNFSKLSSGKIKYVYVKSTSIDEDNPGFFAKPEKVVLTSEKGNFNEFKEEYDKKTVEVKKTLLAISDGEIIDLDNLYKLTNGIMSKLKCKSDVFSFLHFMKDVDEHTFTHSNNVALLCNLFGTWLGLPQEELVYLTTAGILHDIGKTKLDLTILNKQERLTELEYEHIKQHTVLGYRILENQDIPHEIKLSALAHHEKIDGTGYPLSLTDSRINKYGKMVAICDIYDAMTANRVYRGKICPFDVIKSFEQQSYGILDTEYLLVFLENIAYTYLGSWVELSDARKAELVFVHKANLSRPIVRTTEGEILDLSGANDVTIKKII